MKNLEIGMNVISIHSLVKRETGEFKNLNQWAKISIHSLVKRETTISNVSFFDIPYFNPLPRKEGDSR